MGGMDHFGFIITQTYQIPEYNVNILPYAIFTCPI